MLKIKLAVIYGVFAIFLGIESVQGLECYFCGPAKTCENSKVVTCDTTLAEETSTFMSQYFTVPNKTGDNFHCFSLVYTTLDNTQNDVTIYSSCVFGNLKMCRGGAKPKNTVMIQACVSCNTELCNVKNLAGNAAAILSPSFLSLSIGILCFMGIKICWN